MCKHLFSNPSEINGFCYRVCKYSIAGCIHLQCFAKPDELIDFLDVFCYSCKSSSLPWNNLCLAEHSHSKLCFMTMAHISRITILIPLNHFIHNYIWNVDIPCSPSGERWDVSLVNYLCCLTVQFSNLDSHSHFDIKTELVNIPLSGLELPEF